MPKSLTSSQASDNVTLPPLPGFDEAIGRLTRELPEPRKISSGETTGLGVEALDGYLYGERVRYDTQGREWSFRRLPVNDQWQLVITATLFGVPLGAGSVPLDRIAGKEGEDRMLDMVEQLVDEVHERQALARSKQMALRTEADEAVAPLMMQLPEEVATSTDPVWNPAADPKSPELPDLGTGPDRDLIEVKAKGEKEPEPETEPEPKVKPKPAPEPEKHKRRW